MYSNLDREVCKKDMERSKDLGGSLPVDNVQALASNNFKTVPPRYIRPGLEFDEILIDESQQIPVIDMSKLDDLDELLKLHQACKDWGFFQLINHGISETVEKIKEMSENFFKLPLEEKMVHAQLPNSIEGYGQAFVVSEDQKLDWGDMLFIMTQPLSLRNMRFWPTSPPSIRSTLDEYSFELLKVETNLLTMMAKNLGLDQGEFLSLFENGVQGIRMNYYPPCQHADKVVGISPHSDATGLTLLVQINEIQGLQIKKKNKWIPIKPLPGAIIVNIGDIIEILSNEEYKSIEHRAMVNPDKERLSIAAFHSTNLEAMVGPIPDLLVKKSEVAKYKSIDFYEFRRLVVNKKLDGKGLLDQLRID